MKNATLEQPLTRRDFLKTSAVTVAGAALASSLPVESYANVQGSDTIRVGLIGCGGRGTGAAANCMDSAMGVEVIAMGDLFKDRLDTARNELKPHGAQLKVTDSTSFVGWDAYKQVLAEPVNYVILATPPGFRYLHLRAAVEAGKNIFMEKPVAVDPVGIRSVIESSAMAQQKGLSVVSGTQRRHQASYLETIKRIHDGDIGEILSAQCYWNMGGLWNRGRNADWTDMEWQVRNWLYFTWLSGDHITEQHVHNLDVINWVFDSTPVKVLSLGGRQVRTGPEYGHIFDHFATQLIYPNGARVLSQCRQQDGTDSNVSEFVIGTKGTSDPNGHIMGPKAYRHPGGQVDPYVQEHTDNIAAIRSGKPLNEGKRVAESTLTAIMSRMSAYTGKEVTWEQAMNSKLDLRPKEYAFGPLAVAPVAMPGVTALV